MRPRRRPARRNGQRPPVAPGAARSRAYGPVPPPEPGAYGQTPGTAYAVPAPPVTAPRARAAARLPPPPPTRPAACRRLRRRRRAAQGAVDPRPGHRVRRPDRRGADDRSGTRPATTTSRPSPSSPAALAVVAVGLLVGAFLGRARGLIVLGILLSHRHLGRRGRRQPAASAGSASATWAARDGGAAPSSALPARDRRGRLDLTRLPAGSDRRRRGDVGIGQLLIFVPADATVVVDGRRRRRRHAVPGRRTRRGRTTSTGSSRRPRAPARPERTEITIDAEVGFGSWRCAVRRHDLDLVSLITGACSRSSPRHLWARPTGDRSDLRVAGRRCCWSVSGSPASPAPLRSGGRAAATDRRPDRGRDRRPDRRRGAPTATGCGAAAGRISSPVRRTGRLPEWPKGADCKSAGSAYVGSNPSPATHHEGVTVTVTPSSASRPVLGVEVLEPGWQSRRRPVSSSGSRPLSSVGRASPW